MSTNFNTWNLFAFQLKQMVKNILNNRGNLILSDLRNNFNKENFFFLESLSFRDSS